MIEGLILGVVSWLSILGTWWHLPKKAQNFTKQHPLISDIVASALAYILLSSVSKSLIAAVGAIICGLLINYTILGHSWINNES
jgi:ABC-type Fe3+ transport system permease subunit